MVGRYGYGSQYESRVITAQDPFNEMMNRIGHSEEKLWATIKNLWINKLDDWAEIIFDRFMKQ